MRNNDLIKEVPNVVAENWSKIVVNAISVMVASIVMGAGLIVWDQSFSSNKRIGVLAGQFGSLRAEVSKYSKSQEENTKLLSDVDLALKELNEKVEKLNEAHSNDTDTSELVTDSLR